MSDGNAARLQRSYERNLGHSRFWAGVGAALLGSFLLFAAEWLWEIGGEVESTNPGEYSAELVEAENERRGKPDAEQSPPGARISDNIPFLVGLLLLTVAFGACVSLSATFRRLYRQDDAALAEIERGGQNAAP